MCPCLQKEASQEATPRPSPSWPNKATHLLDGCKKTRLASLGLGWLSSLPVSSLSLSWWTHHWEALAWSTSFSALRSFLKALERDWIQRHKTAKLRGYVRTLCLFQLNNRQLSFLGFVLSHFKCSVALNDLPFTSFYLFTYFYYWLIFRDKASLCEPASFLFLSHYFY